LNRGFSGYTSQDLQLILPNLLDHDNTNNSVNIATILLGSNDSVSQSLDKRHVSIVLYKDCMEKIIQELKRREIPHIILMTPPPVDVQHWTKHSFETRGKLFLILPFFLLCWHTNHIKPKKPFF